MVRLLGGGAAENAGASTAGNREGRHPPVASPTLFEPGPVSPAPHWTQDAA